MLILLAIPPLAKPPVQAKQAKHKKTVEAQRAGGWVFFADLPPFAQNKIIVQASTARDAWVVFVAGHHWS